MTHIRDVPDQSDSYKEPQSSWPPTSPNEDGLLMQWIKESPFLLAIYNVLITLCPWLFSNESLNVKVKNLLSKSVAAIKERPTTSIMFGLMAGFGFIPFAGFVLMVCGSFAVLFTWFMFFQFVTVLLSAMVCAGVFWGMVAGFAVLALFLGGTLHMLFAWGVLSKPAGRFVRQLIVSFLRRIGVPDRDLPARPDQD